MTDPSNPDLVEQLAEKYPCYHHSEDLCECAPIDYKAAIREAISVTRRETLEQAAKLADGIWEVVGSLETCKAIAAEIRSLADSSENAARKGK